MGFIQACLEGQDIYQITLDNQGPIIFKLLPYSTFIKVQNLVTNHPRTTVFVEDEVWNLCVLEHPYEDVLEDLLAGTVSTVANLVLFLSGLPDFEDKVELHQYSRYIVSRELLAQISTMLCRTFPSYTPEMLEKLTLPQLFLRVAQAEMARQEEFTLVDPDAEPPKKPTRDFIDFDAENEKMEELGKFTDPHDNYGLRMP